ncbi:Translation elongation factor P [Enhygromyxa salina]|uniref:Translation elongation factor P n=1 Tax=Enhygromyxa salina TaxID=215803 RepID=A0A0C1Z6H9_9BACT|nr:amino acid--tRNA ligase-related protein [Enhygromyxa salina]KIG13204.1 Translation elongation factor P [Enhygromyxa salina]
MPGEVSAAGDGLATRDRVLAWDAALAAVRGQLRAAGLREVSTSIRVDAVALEPWIEPLASGEKLLATSPELAMKRLLCRGGGSMFQIAHVFRAAERGAQHSEEFHLIEWYRDQQARLEGITPGMQDVERIVAAVFEAVGAALGDRVRERLPAPTRWRRVNLLALMGETLGVQLVGNESAEALAPLLDRVRAAGGVVLAAGESGPHHLGLGPDVARLLAWTELFSLWSAHTFDPWLAGLPPDVGVHVERFPASLAALAELEPDERCTAARFESHVGGIELANGYRELRDPVEQRRRFEHVAGIRAHVGLPPLPMPDAFLAELEAMPASVGVALGLDRLVALACGQPRLDQIRLL